MQELDASATELLNERDLKTGLKDDADAIQQQYSDLFKAFRTGIEQLQQELKTKRAELSTAEAEWATKFKEARAARDAVLEKLGEHKTVTSQIIKLREEITEVTIQIGDLEAELKADADPSSILNAALAVLKQVNDQRAERTQEWASEIERLSSGKIKAVVVAAGDTSEINDAVDVIASKTGSQETTRLKELDEALATDFVSNVLDRLRTDCLSLLYWRQMGSASGEEQPACADLMKVLGDTERIRASLTERLDTSRVEAIAAAVPKPEIALSYCDGSREISFEKASPLPP